MTTATTRKAPSATQFCSSAIVNLPVGGMWNQLNAAALATAVAIPSHIPQREASSTGSRYRTPAPATGITSRRP